MVNSEINIKYFAPVHLKKWSNHNLLDRQGYIQGRPMAQILAESTLSPAQSKELRQAQASLLRQGLTDETRAYRINNNQRSSIAVNTKRTLGKSRPVSNYAGNMKTMERTQENRISMITTHRIMKTQSGFTSGGKKAVQ